MHRKKQAAEAAKAGLESDAGEKSEKPAASAAPVKADRKWTRKTMENRNYRRALRKLAARKTFVPFAALTKLIRPIAAEAAEDVGGPQMAASLRISPNALQMLQESAEGYVSEILLKANRYARHANRVTLQKRDLTAVCRDIYEDSGVRITDVDNDPAQ